MPKKIRKIPVVCLVIAVTKLLIGKLKLSNNHVGSEVKNNNGDLFLIFRNILTNKQIKNTETCVFIVSFHFTRFSHKANKLASIIPMLLIAGFPGFVQKMYAVNSINGYWQGMYEWKSIEHLEEYKKSFVYRMMNKRAIPNSIETTEYTNQILIDVIDHYKVEN